MAASGLVINLPLVLLALITAAGLFVAPALVASYLLALSLIHI